jgi:putative transposase
MAARRDLVVKAMDALLQAGVDVGNVQQWCRENGVNPRTFYRHRERIEAEKEWQPRSRRPHTSPAINADLEAWVVKLRDSLEDKGADYILDELKVIWAGSSPGWQVPSRSTVNRILSRHDLLIRNPKKRPRSSYRRFTFARPRDCYQIDATEIVLANGNKVVAFEVLDDCTRMLLACRASPSETGDGAVAAITEAKNRWGAPGIVLSDNGTAFTTRFLSNAKPSQFTVTVNKWGTRLIHSSPYHPQTCGKVERHHQTLKKWLSARPQATTLAGLQRLLDRYRDYYNTRRAHSAIGRKTPADAWNNADSYGGPQHLPILTDATIHTLAVSATGTIGVSPGQRIGVGCKYRGQTLTVIRDRDRATVIDPDGHPLGHATFEHGKSYVRLTPAA